MELDFWLRVHLVCRRITHNEGVSVYRGNGGRWQDTGKRDQIRELIAYDSGHKSIQKATWGFLIYMSISRKNYLRTPFLLAGEVHVNDHLG